APCALLPSSACGTGASVSPPPTATARRSGGTTGSEPRAADARGHGSACDASPSLDLAFVRRVRVPSRAAQADVIVPVAVRVPADAGVGVPQAEVRRPAAVGERVPRILLRQSLAGCPLRALVGAPGRIQPEQDSERHDREDDEPRVPLQSERHRSASESASTWCPTVSPAAW